MKTGSVLTPALAVLALAGCMAAPDPASLDFDPLEATNREAHAVNLQVDRHAYGPAARAYGTMLPEPARMGVTNFIDNIGLPAATIQYMLQGDREQAETAVARFTVNTLFGAGGLFDPATGAGLPYRETNVDETFHVWGYPEGAYWELPVMGPGTQRDWLGWALDIVADPVFYLTGGLEAAALIGLRGADLLNDRYELDAALQSILYESTDSYTALRISYLQNMRARLQGGTDLDLLEDPYADF
jgi:phospholipid-binding lipoprotein MlaA